jgi:hypothetical protein
LLSPRWARGGFWRRRLLTCFDQCRRAREQAVADAGRLRKVPAGASAAVQGACSVDTRAPRAGVGQRGRRSGKRLREDADARPRNRQVSTNGYPIVSGGKLVYDAMAHNANRHLPAPPRPPRPPLSGGLRLGPAHRIACEGHPRPPESGGSAPGPRRPNKPRGGAGARAAGATSPTTRSKARHAPPPPSRPLPSNLCFANYLLKCIFLPLPLSLHAETPSCGQLHMHRTPHPCRPPLRSRCGEIRPRATARSSSSPSSKAATSIRSPPPPFPYLSPYRSPHCMPVAPRHEGRPPPRRPPAKPDARTSTKPDAGVTSTLYPILLVKLIFVFGAGAGLQDRGGGVRPRPQE